MNLRTFLAATAAAGVALALAGSANAANVTQNASASVTIVAPVTISKQADLSFGEISQPSAGKTTTVSIAAAQGAQVAVSGGDAYVANTTSSPAHFVLNGYKGDSFSTVSASGTMTLSGGTATISPSWTTAVTSGVTGTGPWTLAQNSADIYVGGSFNLDSNVAAGAYSGQLTLTVAYP